MTHEERTKLPGVSSNRAKQIVAIAFVTEGVMRNSDLVNEICPWSCAKGVLKYMVGWRKKLDVRCRNSIYPAEPLLW
jgi:exopolyphosphatase/guanosine-5'-triphosphate,3'-diphosphate pyrophosphatase